MEADELKISSFRWKELDAQSLDLKVSKMGDRTRPVTHRATITSTWLRQYILDRGGTLNVTTGMVIVG